LAAAALTFFLRGVEDVYGMADPILTDYTTIAVPIATMVFATVALKKIGRTKKRQQAVH